MSEPPTNNPTSINKNLKSKRSAWQLKYRLKFYYCLINSHNHPTHISKQFGALFVQQWTFWGFQARFLFQLYVPFFFRPWPWWQMCIMCMCMLVTHLWSSISNHTHKSNVTEQPDFCFFCLPLCGLLLSVSFPFVSVLFSQTLTANGHLSLYCSTTINNR